jgi:hypothetical protein
MPKTQCHSPYNMTTNSLYLLKCLVDFFVGIECSMMPLIQRKTNLKEFENHKLRYTMKYGFFYEVFYSFELIIQLLIFLI